MRSDREGKILVNPSEKRHSLSSGSGQIILVFMTIAALTVCRSGDAQQSGTPQSIAPPSLLVQAPPRSAEYAAVQRRLAQGWNTWDTHSVTTQVLLPSGLAVHVQMKHNTTESHDAFLRDALIGRLTPGAEQVYPGPHAWDGSYTEARISWRGHTWKIQGARDGEDLVLLATPLSDSGAVAPTIVFSVDFLWGRQGTVAKKGAVIEAHTPERTVPVYCICGEEERAVDIPVSGPYFAVDFTEPVAITTGKPRTLAEVRAVLDRQHQAYESSLPSDPNTRPIIDAIETTLGWDTIYEPVGQRVISPVSRVWSVDWGGYVLFDWDTFFAATMAGVGDRDLAYADALEILREETAQGFVPNYARGGEWKSTDRSEPPVGAITVLGLYRKFGERWLLRDAFAPLLRWNRWWAEHRDTGGYLTWGSDGHNEPQNLEDRSRGTRTGAILESGLDNSPMYDATTFDEKTHLLEFADVGLMSLYVADCDALAAIADALDETAAATELRGRSARYREKLLTLWSPADGIFLNKDLHTGAYSHRLSPTNFYPLLARAATPSQAQEMIDRHLKNENEFWGEWIVPSIARNDPAFRDQNYWRGRIWGPMNYLVYLGLRNYEDAATRRDFAEKSYALFAKEWRAQGHVHENYNAISGTGDDVANSDRFYHWGALLGWIEYLEQTPSSSATNHHAQEASK
jgi:hypothetical protein